MINIHPVPSGLISRSAAQGRSSAKHDRRRWISLGKPDRLVADGPEMDHRGSTLGMSWLHGYQQQWLQYKKRPSCITLTYAVIVLMPSDAQDQSAPRPNP